MTQLFEVTETAKFGLYIAGRPSRPYIPTPPGCPQLIFDQKVVDIIKEVPDDYTLRYGADERLKDPNDPDSWVLTTCHVRVDVQPNHIMLRLPLGKHDRADGRAIVLVNTSGGDGGKVWLRANVMQELMKNAKPPVVRDWASFPGLGVVPLCNAETLASMNYGVDHAHWLLGMEPGSSFRIHRHGRLEGAAPCIIVQWKNGLLTTTDYHNYSPRPASLGTLSLGAGT